VVTTLPFPTPNKVPRPVVALLAILAFTSFVTVLNETALSVALPALMQQFGVDAGTVQWLTTGYILVLAVVIPTTGHLMQRFSLRALWFASIGVFIVGSVAAAAVSDSFATMLVARVLQAAGNAAVMPLLATTALARVHPSRLGTVMGTNAVVLAAGPALGPTVAGLILGIWDWREIFWIMAGLAAILLALGVRPMLRQGPARATGRDEAAPPLDLPSVGLTVLGFGGIVYALAGIEAVLDGAWIAPTIAAAVGLAAVVVFCLRQLRLVPRGRALLNLTALSTAGYRRAVIAIGLGFAILVGQAVVLSLVLQNGYGLSTAATGLALLPMGLVQVVASPILGRLYDTLGPRPLAIPASLLLGTGSLVLCFMSPAMPVWLLVTATALFGLGMSGMFSAVMTAGLASLPLRLHGDGTAIVNTIQQVAAAAGTAVLTAALVLGSGGLTERVGPVFAGGRTAYVVATVACIGAAIAAFRIKRPDVIR
jgi:DHA2 family lincomycin resistance protein-like MFS transporter